MTKNENKKLRHLNLNYYEIESYSSLILIAMIYHIHAQILKVK